MVYFLVLASIVIGVARFFVPSHELSAAGSYEAVAHILVGFLLAVGVQRMPESYAVFCEQLRRNRVVAMTCLGVITAIEIVMFMMR